MAPLSLSVTSPARPAYLSTNVLDEMENFLYSLAWYLSFSSTKVFLNFLVSFPNLIARVVHFSYDEKLDSSGMQVLIEFSLARGNLGGVFKVLRLLYGMIDTFRRSLLLRV